MAGADNFGIEQSKAAEAIEWISEYARKNKLKFDAKMTGSTLQTAKFGTFELFAWNGEWSTARNAVRKASGKLGIKTIESGFHEERGLLSAMFGASSEYAKVYSGGRLVGNLELVKKSGKWSVRSESYA